jgi:hypothetical protein
VLTVQYLSENTTSSSCISSINDQSQWFTSSFHDFRPFKQPFRLLFCILEGFGWCFCNRHRFPCKTSLVHIQLALDQNTITLYFTFRLEDISWHQGNRRHFSYLPTPHYPHRGIVLSQLLNLQIAGSKQEVIDDSRDERYADQRHSEEYEVFEDIDSTGDVLQDVEDAQHLIGEVAWKGGNFDRVLAKSE